MAEGRPERSQSPPLKLSAQEDLLGEGFRFEARRNSFVRGRGGRPAGGIGRSSAPAPERQGELPEIVLVKEEPARAVPPI